MKVLVDNGHGENTVGKRSPDGLFREYKYTREVASEIVKRLQAKGVDAVLITPEETDVTLEERVRRVNNICNENGVYETLLLSIHCNAASNGQWAKARGWSAYTTKGVTRSDELATMLYAEAIKTFKGQTIRKDFSDNDPDWEENFYIIRKTKCPAVLTENFFMDNREDLTYLQSEKGREAIINVHVNAILQYVQKYS